MYFPLTSKTSVRKKSKLIVCVLLKFSILQDRNIRRPQCCNEFHSSVCVQPPWHQAEPEHVNPMYVPEVWRLHMLKISNQTAIAECSNTVPTHGLILHSVHEVTNYSSKTPKCPDIFPKNKTNYLNPHRISLFSFLNLTSAVISQNSTQESSSLEFLKCVNFSYCAETATALPNQLHLSVICQAALAICLQSTARRYINFPRWGRCWIYTDKWQTSSEWECVQE